MTEYLLNDDHPDGAPKSAFFKSFGFASSRPDELVAALLSHPVRNEVTSRILNDYGTKFVIRCGLETPDGRNPCIFSVWIVEPGDLGPRFVTAYPGG